MFSLYEIQNSYAALLDVLDADEIDEGQLNVALENIKDTLHQKADNYAGLIQSLDAESAGLKAEEERLAARRKRNENTKKWLKSNLENAMIQMGETKFKTAKFSFGIQKNPASVEINCDIGSLPEEFQKISITADKSKLKNAIQNGEEIPGVSLKQSESLRIR